MFGWIVNLFRGRWSEKDARDVKIASRPRPPAQPVTGRTKRAAGVTKIVPRPRPPSQPVTGRWELRDHTDPSTGIRTMGVALRSFLHHSAGGYDGAVLDVSCSLRAGSAPEWGLAIGWGECVRSGKTAMVTTRYGMGQAVTEGWGLFTDGEGTFAPLSGDAISKLLKTDRFEARVVKASGLVLAATWDVRGLRKALKPVVAVCPLPRAENADQRLPVDRGARSPTQHAARRSENTDRRSTLAPSPSLLSQPFTGGWKLFDHTNSSTSTRWTGVRLRSFFHRSSGGYEGAELVVSCVLPAGGAAVWEVGIDWGERVGSGSGWMEAVTTRYRTERAVTMGDMQWRLPGETGGPIKIELNQGRWRMLPSAAGGPGCVIGGLQKADQFEVRVATVGGKLLTATWDVRGLREALRPLVAVCPLPRAESAVPVFSSALVPGPSPQGFWVIEGWVCSRPPETHHGGKRW